MAVICNIVLVGRLSGLDFKQSVQNFRKQSKKRQSTTFTGVSIALCGCTCLLFPNGAVTIVGVKSVSRISRIPFQLSCILPGSCLITDSKIDYNSGCPGLRVCNIVASTCAPCKLNMSVLYDYIRTKTVFRILKRHFRA